MTKLKDSGKRTQFNTGAVREIDETKGRCDLVYNRGWFDITGDMFYLYLEDFVREGNREDVEGALSRVIQKCFDGNYDTAYLEVSQHYAEGAKKYADRNMEK